MFEEQQEAMIQSSLKDGLRNGSKKYKVDIEDICIVIYTSSDNDTPLYKYITKDKENPDGEWKSLKLDFDKDIFGVMLDLMFRKMAIIDPRVKKALQKLCDTYSIVWENVNIVIAASKMAGNDLVMSIIPYNEYDQLCGADGKEIYLPLSYFVDVNSPIEGVPL